MSHKLVSNLGVAGGLWSDPLSYILPHSDADYQQALQERSLNPDKYSSLNGLFAAFGYVNKHRYGNAVVRVQMWKNCCRAGRW